MGRESAFIGVLLMYADVLTTGGGLHTQKVRRHSSLTPIRRLQDQKHGIF